MRIQVNSLGKAYLTSSNKVLKAPDGGGDTITATNNTGASISSGDKVWVEYSQNNSQIKNLYIAPNVGYQIVGSPTINDNVISGFSGSNYITLQKTLPTSTASSWEMVFKIKYNSSRDWQRLCGALNNTSLAQIVIGIDYNKLITWMSSNGSQWNIADGVQGSITFSNNTVYWVKARFTGSQYIISLSTDGISYTDDITINNSTKLYQNNSVFIMGSAERSNSTWMAGLLYIDGCHIKINGDYWWTGTNPDIDVDNLYSGIAQENIANGSSGSVKTILGE